MFCRHFRHARLGLARFNLAFALALPLLFASVFAAATAQAQIVTVRSVRVEPATLTLAPNHPERP